MWLKLLEHIRTILLMLFVFMIIALYFDWFKGGDILNKETLNDLKNIAIILYIIVYVIELRLKLHDKTIEIGKLKTQLSNYEK